MKLADVANLILTCYRFTLPRWPDVRDLRAFIKEKRGTPKFDIPCGVICQCQEFESRYPLSHPKKEKRGTDGSRFESRCAPKGSKAYCAFITEFLDEYDIPQYL